LKGYVPEGKVGGRMGRNLTKGEVMWLVEGKLFINNEIRHFKCLVDPGEQ
jgi:hypothetical protein